MSDLCLQLCLHWKLSKRKCETNNMMEYVSTCAEDNTRQQEKACLSSLCTIFCKLLSSISVFV